MEHFSNEIKEESILCSIIWKCCFIWKMKSRKFPGRYNVKVTLKGFFWDLVRNAWVCARTFLRVCVCVCAWLLQIRPFVDPKLLSFLFFFRFFSFFILFPIWACFHIANPFVFVPLISNVRISLKYVLRQPTRSTLEKERR